MGLFFISHVQVYDSSSLGGEWGNPDIALQCGEQTPVGSWDTLVDQLAPKTPHVPFMWHPEKEPCGSRLPRELPAAPKPSQKEGEAGSHGPPETPWLHSRYLIPEASKALGIRDSNQVMLVQGAGNSPRLQSPKGQTRIAAAP